MHLRGYLVFPVSVCGSERARPAPSSPRSVAPSSTQDSWRPPQSYGRESCEPPEASRTSHPSAGGEQGTARASPARPPRGSQASAPGLQTLCAAASRHFRRAHRAPLFASQLRHGPRSHTGPRARRELAAVSSPGRRAGVSTTRDYPAFLTTRDTACFLPESVSPSCLLRAPGAPRGSRCPPDSSTSAVCLSLAPEAGLLF